MEFEKCAYIDGSSKLSHILKTHEWTEKLQPFKFSQHNTE